MQSTKKSTKDKSKKEIEIHYIEPDYSEAIGFGIGFLFGIGRL